MSKVSVVVPSYNQAKYIKNCIKSILSQTKKAHEIIVADDCSTDDTQNILKPYKGKIKFYIHKKNMGSYNYTYNTGVKNSTGDYIVIVSADDWLAPTMLEEESKMLDQNSQIGLVYSQAYNFENGRKILKMPKPAGTKTYIARKNDYELLLTKGDFIPSINAMVRRDIYKKLGLFDTNLRYMADYEMWIRIAQKYPLAYIAKPLTYYRIHGKNLHLNLDFDQRNEFEFKYILKKYLLGKKLQKSEEGLKKTALHNYYLKVCTNSVFKKDIKRAKSFWVKALKEKPSSLFSWEMAQPAYFKIRELIKGI